MRKSQSKWLVDLFSEIFASAILLHRRDRHLQCDQTNGAQFRRSHINIINQFDYYKNGEFKDRRTWRLCGGKREWRQCCKGCCKAYDWGITWEHKSPSVFLCFILVEFEMESLNIVELDALELEEMNGGGIVKDIYDMVIDLDGRWDSIKHRFMVGWNRYK